MCVPDNSVDLYTSTCPMCKVFRHPTRCPHKRETCRNRVNHPRHDVVYISNAEVPTFKGCGYCKWVSTNPPPPVNRSGMLNPGWPGCCRAPQSSDIDKIPPADWPAVYTIHRTPIPPDIRQLLESLKSPYGLSPASPTSPSNLNAIASTNFGAKDATKVTGAERKGLARANSSPSGSLRSPSQKTRSPISGTGSGSGSSPQMKQARLAGQPGTSPAANGSLPTDSIQSSLFYERRSNPQKPLKRVEGFRTTPPASMRRLSAESEKQDYSATRTSLSSVNLSALATSEREQPQVKKHASVPRTNTTPPPVTTKTTTPKSVSKSLDRDPPKAADRDRSVNASLEKGLKALSLSSAKSNSSSDSGSRGSSNDASTVTSDGGFTDYLSDESEAELQRQAEIKAALLEQNRLEEQEFKAARRQLANVDLQPPQVWTTGRKAINAGFARGG